MNREPINALSPETIKTMFNAIAPTYDRLNRILSFGLDRGWRKRAIRLLEEKRGGTILDIAAGSGDFTIDAQYLQPATVVATDFAFQMLRTFQGKLLRGDLSRSICLASCDALSLPFRSSSFDATLVAFGIRNFADRFRALQEMHRVLKPKGITIVLELTKPTTPVIEQCYGIYTRILLPIIGELISRHNGAYKYLPQSIAAFPSQAEFLSLIEQAGFIEANAIPLTFGTATIFLGRKG